MVRGPWTVVSLHAHPDDEALLTGGTLARLAAEGHRVVLVVATDGAAGLADHPGAGLAELRAAELAASAAALGVARVVRLGYPDSGDDGDRPGGFATADVGQAADRLAELLRAERADVLTSYDAAGGYGHPDHRQVHLVGAAAAALAHTPLVLEATVDADLLGRVTRLLAKVPGLPADLSAPRLAAGYTPRRRLTHRVDVRPYAAAKRAAMAAHASQAGAPAGSDRRTLALLLRLPGPLFRFALGREWFVEAGRPPGPLLDDALATLRTSA